MNAASDHDDVETDVVVETDDEFVDELALEFGRYLGEGTAVLAAGRGRTRQVARRWTW